MVTGPSEGGMVGSALTSPGLGGAQAARAAAVSPAPEPISAVRRENLLISAVSSPHPRGLGVCRAPRWRPPELCPSCRIHTLTRRSARTTRESLRTDQSRGARSANVHVNVHANRHVSPHLGWMEAIEPHRAISDGRHTEENT